MAHELIKRVRSMYAVCSGWGSTNSPPVGFMHKPQSLCSSRTSGGATLGLGVSVLLLEVHEWPRRALPQV